jgi:hypothetical protein
MHLKAINGNSVPSSPLPLFPNPSDDNDNRINPLAGLGLSDEQYNAMLSDLLGVTGEAFGGVGPEKRLLEGEDEGSGREGKRGRFEELNEWENRVKALVILVSVFLRRSVQMVSLSYAVSFLHHLLYHVSSLVFLLCRRIIYCI